MKMLCGLLPPTEGQAWLFGEPVDANDIDIRRKVGYMSQAFSLYSELTVRQNLVLHAQLFHVPPRRDPGARRRDGRAVRPRRDHGGAARLAPAGATAAPAARRGADPPARPADPRRADLGGRPGRPGRLLGAPDRAVPPRQGHDLRLHPLHQRGRALRPHLADERRERCWSSTRRTAWSRSAARRRWKTPSSATWKRRAARTTRRRRRPSHAGRGGRAASPTRRPGRHAGSWFSLQRMLACSYRELLELTPRPDPPDDGRPGQRAS